MRTSRGSAPSRRGRASGAPARGAAAVAGCQCSCSSAMPRCGRARSRQSRPGQSRRRPWARSCRAGAGGVRAVEAQAVQLQAVARQAQAVELADAQALAEGESIEENRGSGEQRQQRQHGEPAAPAGRACGHRECPRGGYGARVTGAAPGGKHAAANPAAPSCGPQGAVLTCATVFRAVPARFRGHPCISTFLGICGTFMGSLAVLAKNSASRVTGSDANVYPPMAPSSKPRGIELLQGYEPAHLDPAPDLVVIGNALSRGNPAVKHVLNAGLRLRQRPAVAGRPRAAGPLGAGGGRHPRQDHHQQHAGLGAGGRRDEPGLPDRRGAAELRRVARAWAARRSSWSRPTSTTAPSSTSASKFVHYRPRTAILNNLEFDHADIFPDLAAIERQFHHLVRTVPGRGADYPPGRRARRWKRVLETGCWTPVREHRPRRPVAGPAARCRRLALRGDPRRRRAGVRRVGAERPAQRRQRPGHPGRGAPRRRRPGPGLRRTVVVPAASSGAWRRSPRSAA